MTTEARRQFYLGMAGVQMWYARAPLPGAAPSPVFDFSEPDVRSATIPAQGKAAKGGRGPDDQPGGVTSPVSDRAPGTSKAARSSPQPPRSGASRASGRRLTELMDAPPAPTRPRVPPSTSPPAAPVEEPLKADVGVSEPSEGQVVASSAGSVPESVNLGVWLGKRFALVSEWADDASGRLQTSLAGNILKSLDDAEAAFHGTFCWPVFANPRVAARDSGLLTDVLRRFLEPIGDRQVLWLGSQGDDASGWLHGALRQPPRIRFPRSLAALASDPALKRELWSVLKPLARP